MPSPMFFRAGDRDKVTGMSVHAWTVLRLHLRLLLSLIALSTLATSQEMVQIVYPRVGSGGSLMYGNMLPKNWGYKKWFAMPGYHSFDSITGGGAILVKNASKSIVIASPVTAYYNYFGQTLEVFPGDNVALVGAPGSVVQSQLNAGVVYLVTPPAAGSDMYQLTQIVSPSPRANGTFGAGMVSSASGGISGIFVSAPFEEGALGPGSFGRIYHVTNTGAIETVALGTMTSTSPSGPGWVQPIDQSGNYLALGYPGAVEVFARDLGAPGITYFSETVLLSSGVPSATSSFGATVKFFENAGSDKYLAVSDPGYNSDIGRVHVYKRTGPGSWQPQYDLQSQFSDTIKFGRGDFEVRKVSGSSPCVGLHIMIGCPGENGRIERFILPDGSLTPVPNGAIYPPAGYPTEGFGQSFFADLNIADCSFRGTVSAPFATVDGASAYGAIYDFSANGVDYLLPYLRASEPRIDIDETGQRLYQVGEVYAEQALGDCDPGAGEGLHRWELNSFSGEFSKPTNFYGGSVPFSVSVGGPKGPVVGIGSEAFYPFNPKASCGVQVGALAHWKGTGPEGVPLAVIDPGTGQPFLPESASSRSSDLLVVPGRVNNLLRIAVLGKTQGEWKVQAMLAPPVDGIVYTTAVSGDRIAVSVVLPNHADEARVFIYRRILGAIWALETTLSYITNGWANVSLAADGTMLAVGVDDDWSSQTGTPSPYGRVYVYRYAVGSGWTQDQLIAPEVSLPYTGFGRSVRFSPSGALLAVGAPEEGALGFGSVYVFEAGNGFSTQLFRVSGDELGVAEIGGPIGSGGLAISEQHLVLYGRRQNASGPGLNLGRSELLVFDLSAASGGGTWTSVGDGLSGASGVPELVGGGLLADAEPGGLALSHGSANAPCALFAATSIGGKPFKGGVLVAEPVAGIFFLLTDASGAFSLNWVFPAGVPVGTLFCFQVAIEDVGAIKGVSLSNGVSAFSQ